MCADMKRGALMQVGGGGGGVPGPKSSRASRVALAVKNPRASAGDEGDEGSIPGSGRSPGGGHGSPLQYSCLGNPVDSGAWRATVQGVTKSQKVGCDWAHTHKSPKGTGCGGGYSLSCSHQRSCVRTFSPPGLPHLFLSLLCLVSTLASAFKPCGLVPSSMKTSLTSLTKWLYYYFLISCAFMCSL